jgi:hypothetical protein
VAIVGSVSGSGNGSQTTQLTQYSNVTNVITTISVVYYISVMKYAAKDWSYRFISYFMLIVQRSRGFPDVLPVERK